MPKVDKYGRGGGVFKLHWTSADCIVVLTFVSFLVLYSNFDIYLFYLLIHT